jgi:hypothetical protein
MSEFQHHTNWLRAIEDRLAQGRPLDEKERTDAIGTCEWVLSQNPASEMAAGILTRIRGVMAPAVATAPETVVRPGSTVTTDLVTGASVVNIRMTNVSNQHGEYVYRGLNGAFEQSRRGGRWNIRPIVDACHNGGPFPGFLDVLTPEQRAELHRADADLCELCYRQFVRLCLAEDTEGIISAADAAIDRHIVPLVGLIRTPETRKSVEGTLAIWKRNLGNPTRNMYHRTTRWFANGEQIGRQYAMPMYRQDPAYFSVGIMDQHVAGDNVGAGYDAPMRTMLIRKPPQGGYNFLEALNVLHEGTHVKQHGEFIVKHSRGDLGRIDVCHDAYVAPMITSNSAGHGIVEEEGEAFANMIEVIIARTGFGDLQIAPMLRSFGIPENDRQAASELVTLLQLAQPYYQGGGRKGNVFPPAYLSAIESMYRRQGMNVMHQRDILPPA